LENNDQKIILFDGVCNLCNGAVNFVIKNERGDRFRFAALQEEPGHSLLKKFDIDPALTDSIVLIENGRAFVKSTAALRIARGLKGLYPLLYGFMIIPKGLRNHIYDYVAKNRYRWFGKKESCMIPSPDLQAKFL